MVDRIQQLEALLEREPNDAFCLYGLAMEHARLGRHEIAVQWFERAIASDPNHCYAYFHKARSLENIGDLPAAQASLRAGLLRAKVLSDSKAASELASYLDQLT